MRRTYVLDTSVLLADPAAFTRFAEHHVVLPVVVVDELETKRKDPELGYFARSALRLLDDLRALHGRLDQPLPVGTDGGTYTGMAELDVSSDDLLPCHCGLVLLSPRGSAVGRVAQDKCVRLGRGDRDAFGLHDRSAEQRVALQLLLFSGHPDP